MCFTSIFVILLFVFIAAFISLGYFDVQISENATLLTTLNDIGITTAQIQLFLGVGILFCQLAIILFSMLDKIGYAVRAVVIPILRLVPLMAFLVSVWRTYSPIVFNLLPDQIADIFGVTTTESYLATAVNDGTFSRNVIITLITMLVFVLFSYALRPGDSQQVRALKAENAKLRKQVRSL